MKNGVTKLFILWLIYAVSWIINVIKLCMCDFEPSYKEEIIHGVGAFVPFSSLITMWF